MASVLVALIFTLTAWASSPVLTPQQESAFRGWFTRIVWEQLRFRANARWTHRDCAGLVRFALKEALADHTPEWKQQNSVSPMLAPPDVDLKDSEREKLSSWPFEKAILLVQNRTRFLTKDINEARPGDLLFFDFGETQHLMIWMGSYVAYHNGSPTPTDPGLRKLEWHTLMNWKDTRWRPLPHNPNFAGIYRFSFLR